MGGLRAAYFTDLIQGLCIIVLSIILIPYGLSAIVYGSLCTFFILFCADMLVYLSGWAVSIGAGRDLVPALTRFAPLASGWRLSESTSLLK